MALGLFLNEIMEPALQIVTSDPWFRARIEDYFYKARELVDKSELEVLTSACGEFIIGDVPALTIPREGSRPGVLDGTAFGDARTVIMPLGPQHIVALARTNVNAELNSDQVNLANTYQVRGALEYVYFRPGSTLAQFVRSILPAI